MRSDTLGMIAQGAALVAAMAVVSALGLRIGGLAGGFLAIAGGVSATAVAAAVMRAIGREGRGRRAPEDGSLGEGR